MKQFESLAPPRLGGRRAVAFGRDNGHRHLPPQVTPGNSPSLKAVRPPTSGPWFDVHAATRLRESLHGPTDPSSPMLYLLDLNSVHPSIAVLDAYLREFAKQIKAGKYGDSAVVVSTQDESVRRYVEMLAAQDELPIYVSASTTSFALIQAEPAARLTETERLTLRTVMDLGGTADARRVAHHLGLKHTTAVNRLNALCAKGLLSKKRRPGRTTDLYTDFRAASAQYSHETLDDLLPSSNGVSR